MTSVGSCLAIIPARGGSKGLPGKNILPLAGLPLLVHSLRCAQIATRITRTIVSTDSEEIAAVARAAGGDVPFLRPSELATDHTPTMPVLVHALETLERSGERYDSVLLLEPTSPGRLPDDIDRALELLGSDAEADGVVACSRPSFNPFYVGVVARERYITPAFPSGGAHTRRQDAPDFLRINGALFLWRSEFLRRTPSEWVTAGRHLPLEIPETRAFSIDDADELRLAELMLGSGLVRLPWLAQG